MDLPQWLDLDLWNEFVGHREDIKKPMSERAQKMALKKLELIRDRGFDANESLMTSVMNGWQGLFEIERKEVAHKPASHKQTALPDYGQRTEPETARNNVSQLMAKVRGR